MLHLRRMRPAHHLRTARPPQDLPPQRRDHDRGQHEVLLLTAPHRDPPRVTGFPAVDAAGPRDLRKTPTQGVRSFPRSGRRSPDQGSGRPGKRRHAKHPQTTNAPPLERSARFLIRHRCPTEERTTPPHPTTQNANRPERRTTPRNRCRIPFRGRAPPEAAVDFDLPTHRPTQGADATEDTDTRTRGGRPEGGRQAPEERGPPVTRTRHEAQRSAGKPRRAYRTRCLK
jgi:hypothetical protein